MDGASPTDDGEATLTLATASATIAKLRDDLTKAKAELFCAQDARRTMESRLEDMKREMASMERKYTACVSELTTYKTAAHSKDEERAMKARVEELEKEKVAGLEEMQRRHEKEVKELQAQCQDLTAKAAKVAPPMEVQRRGGILDILRCPLRADAATDKVSYSSQDICWRVLSHVKDITCLLCSFSEYRIMEASRTACKIWGSAALQGQSVLELVNGPSRAAWLRKAFETHQRFAEMQVDEPGQTPGNTVGIPGFLVRDLGCEEFLSKGGNVFDSSVITAHLPAEPRCRKPAALLVIIEPHSDFNPATGMPVVSSSSDRGGPRGGGGPGSFVDREQGSQMRPNIPRRRGAAASSEVSTSTVNPSDSASNIQHNALHPSSRAW